MSVYTVSLRDTSNLGQVNIGDGTLLANLSVAAGRGPKGDGWTGVTYDESTGTFIFTSNDGLAYTSPDVRPEVDLDNVDINSGTIDGTVIGGSTAAAGSFTTGSFAGDVSFGDNDKAIFGAGSDLQIYHQTTGTAGSYIAENGTGDLRISGNNLWLNDVSGDTYFRAVNGSYAKLYHAGDEKIATTSTGIDVTGTVTADALDLNAIAETKAVTAVDVFVYDTSKDSDGGAWRKRTQATSWYNETLNTATRGARREFPAVAVIVAENDTVTIYDGDDPDLPMWMVFNSAGSTETDCKLLHLNTSNKEATACSALNGILCVSAESTGVTRINLISDKSIRSRSSGTFTFLGNISERNDTLGGVDDDSQNIVNDTCKDVAMTVLPDAPIDAATGLPVPTIAVATANGVSVIKDDGTVVDSASTSITLFLSFSDEGLWYGYDTTFSFATNADFLAGDGFGDITASTNGNYALDLKIRWRKEMFTFGDTLVGGGGLVPKQGFEQFSLDYNDFSNSMKSETTSNFATGWQHGDIKGAFLSSTDTTSLVGGNIFTNSSFSTGDETGWTANAAHLVGTGDGSVDFSVVGQVTITEQGGSDRSISQIAVGSKAGDTLKITRTTSAISASSSSAVRIAYGGSTTPYIGMGYPAGTYVSYVTAVNDEQRITIHVSSTNATVTITNFEVEIVDADRSVNASGLTVNGTITRTPVATDADLVGYSGFSASNYLEQPYNSDLDFGTGDFCVMGWITASASSDWLLSRQTSGDIYSAGFYVFQSGSTLKFRTHDGSSHTEQQSLDLPPSAYSHFVAVRQSGVSYLYINGVLADSSTDTRDVTNTSAVLIVGDRIDGGGAWANGSIALLRISATAPSAEQIAKIYNDEKVLFQENAQATLYGTSDAVTTLSHDDGTDLLHVGTNAGRSVFQGLRRVSNTTTVVTTAISASNGLVVEE